MAEYVTLTCPSCGSRLQVTNDLDRFACGYCGNELHVNRGGGVISLKPVMDGLDRVESKLDQNTEEIRRLRIVSEIDELQRSRASMLQTIAMQESTDKLAQVGKRRHPVRGVFLGLIALSLFVSSCSALAAGGADGLMTLLFAGLVAWWSLSSFGVRIFSRRVRGLQSEADQLGRRVEAKRRELGSG